MSNKSDQGLTDNEQIMADYIFCDGWNDVNQLNYLNEKNYD